MKSYLLMSEALEPTTGGYNQRAVPKHLEWSPLPFLLDLDLQQEQINEGSNIHSTLDLSPISLLDLCNCTRPLGTTNDVSSHE